MANRLFSLLSSLLLALPLSAQTIAEKKASIENGGLYLDISLAEDLKEVNATLSELRGQLKELYQEARILYRENGEDEELLCALLEDIQHIKEQIQEVETLWKKEVASSNMQEQYGLMHAPDVHLSELVMDYGASDYLYIIPTEMEQMRLNVSSNIPIPKESWQESLESILSHYGISMRRVSPYIKELYFSESDFSGLYAITDREEELTFMPQKERVCFIMSDEESDPRGSLLFLKKFSNPKTTSIELFGGRIFIIARVDHLQELFKLYSFAKTKTGRQELKLVTLHKLDAIEMNSILQIAFDEGAYPADESNLRIMPLQSLPHALVLAGSTSEIAKAEKIIGEVENNLQNPDENTLFWYTAKHSDAAELAELLSKVYLLLCNSPTSLSSESIDAKIAEAKETITKKEDNLTVAPPKIAPNKRQKAGKSTSEQHNFIVDPKTGAIMMVVRRDLLPQIKHLLKRLDVPKKMVQIEVLLFEKKITNNSKSGLNLLKLGSSAANTVAQGACFQNGILEFFISRGKSESGIPAYDLAYNFLLGQEDVQINASPSVTTMNQTPATIAIVEEISLDSGSDEKKNRIYKRAQYGITLQITPTINFDLESNEANYITLETDITFDTTKNSTQNRPDVTRRHIQNHVRIKDGETIILGGLRRKNQEDKKDSIPFLGEIPGLGKLFSSTEMSDSSTEMFVFITPKILSCALEEAESAKLDQLSKRAGDLPEFLEELTLAKNKEKQRLFEKSITALFGREKEKKERSRNCQGEYDGRG